MSSSTRIQRMANLCVRNDAEEIWRFSATSFCFILFCFIWKPWSVNLVFMFGKNPPAMEVLKLCSLQTVCLEVLSLSHTSSIFFFPSLCLRTFVIENPGVWLRACGLSPPYFICIMGHRWLNCKCTPWLVLLQYVINVCFFFLGFLIFCVCFMPSQGAADWMNQTLCLFQSPRCFIYRGKSTLTPLRSLWKIYQALSQLPRCLTWTVVLEVQMCVVGQCNVSVCRSGVCFHPSTLATILPSCPCCDMASSVVMAFIIQSYQ